MSNIGNSVFLMLNKLITGRGATNQQGVQVKFYPCKKGHQNSFSHAEGGHKRFVIVLTQGLDVLGLLKEGRKMVPPFKGEPRKRFTLS